jgi:hypothetical protein
MIVVIAIDGFLSEISLELQPISFSVRLTMTEAERKEDATAPHTCQWDHVYMLLTVLLYQSRLESTPLHLHFDTLVPERKQTKTNSSFNAIISPTPGLMTLHLNLSLVRAL